MGAFDRRKTRKMRRRRSQRKKKARETRQADAVAASRRAGDKSRSAG